MCVSLREGEGSLGLALGRLFILGPQCEGGADAYLRRTGLPARWCLLLRLRGRCGGVRALAGAAACLCAGAGLLHLPPLGQGSLIHCLQPEAFPLTLVEGL